EAREGVVVWVPFRSLETDRAEPAEDLPLAACAFGPTFEVAFPTDSDPDASGAAQAEHEVEATNGSVCGQTGEVEAHLSLEGDADEYPRARARQHRRGGRTRLRLPRREDFRRRRIESRERESPDTVDPVEIARDIDAPRAWGERVCRGRAVETGRRRDAHAPSAGRFPVRTERKDLERGRPVDAREDPPGTNSGRHQRAPRACGGRSRTPPPFQPSGLRIDHADRDPPLPSTEEAADQNGATVADEHVDAGSVEARPADVRFPGGVDRAGRGVERAHRRARLRAAATATDDQPPASAEEGLASGPGVGPRAPAPVEPPAVDVEGADVEAWFPLKSGEVTGYIQAGSDAREARP